ncbi:hypothetical protein I7I50_00034 [Histoplasma capsulatum G186AR]|uniref:Uncharacterized protein n=1 Tax=Ajellomyces capsulatus TaxID=5037 RepID=A0A8H8CUG9_AJECA|nr:hypothetical protein I7I52_07303 [Histoplasma capsulatum]QSS72242.1 hypothetical protein I7I50_00034 [Histoplasma capsulatum G186AR]
MIQEQRDGVSLENKRRCYSVRWRKTRDACPLISGNAPKLVAINVNRGSRSATEFKVNRLVGTAN